MKNVYLAFLLLFLFSCYSPKSKVEKDKHPEIPEFPKFDSKEVNPEKLIEIPMKEDARCMYLIKDDILFIYIEKDGKQVNEISLREHAILILKNGKIFLSDFWTDSSMVLSVFLDLENNIYVGNRRYEAPNYTIKKEISSLSTLSVDKEYERLQLQKKTFENIQSVYQVPSYFYTADTTFNLKESKFLCNMNSENPFYIDKYFFEKINSYGIDSTYYYSVLKKVKFLKGEQFFTDKIDTVDQDFNFFEKTGSIVVGNNYFSHGNHFIGSSGYEPVYLTYYELNYKNKKTKTKENNLNQVLLKPIKLGEDWYFISFSNPLTKMTIFHLN